HFTDAKNYVVYDLKTIPPGYDWSTSDPNPPSFATLASGKIDDNAQTSDFITFGGVKVQIDGEPQGGDTFSIKRQPDQEKRSLLNTVSDLRKALLSAEDTPAGNLAIRDAVGVAISNLDS
ncbi:flagellar biosynthesis protein FlgL, partial [Pseudomonas aeruginosa]|nr:flagellar biosynthesis protein FlgL [Pseudomonas aeruginosa]